MAESSTSMDNQTPRVSVIVPVYNGEAYLAQCLDSLLAQTLASIEVICVDDGSCDGTAEILAAYAARDPRVRLMSQQNAGPGAARNHGMARATGEYLYFFDADDWCEPELLKRAVEVGDAYEADVVALPFKLYNQHAATPISVAWSLPRWQWPEGAFSWRANPDALFSTFRTVPWNKLVRATFMREHGICFQEDIRLSEDVMFSFPAAALAQRIACVDEALLYHREGVGLSAMDTKDEHPLDFVSAFTHLRAFLQEQGIYDELERAYANWVIAGSAYNLLTLHSLEAFNQVFDYLHQQGLEEMGVRGYDRAKIGDAFYAPVMDALEAGNKEALLFSEQARVRTDADGAYYQVEVKAEEIARLQAENERLQAENAALAAQLDESRQAHAALEDQFTRTMNATEQRVGKAICYVPRAVQRVILAHKNKQD